NTMRIGSVTAVAMLRPTIIASVADRNRHHARTLPLGAGLHAAIRAFHQKFPGERMCISKQRGQTRLSFNRRPAEKFGMALLDLRNLRWASGVGGYVGVATTRNRPVP